MKICRIESLLYGVEDLEAGIRYFEDWGVPLVKRGRRELAQGHREGARARP